MTRAPTPTVLAVVGLAAAGCVAVPPLKLGGGIAVSGKGDQAVAAAHAAANVRPLAVAPSLKARPVDVSAGAFFEYSDRDELRLPQRILVGPTVGVEGYPIVWPSPDVPEGRLVVGGELRALYQPEVDSWGPFVAERIGLELVKYVEGCDAGGGQGGLFIGCGAGEAGVGVFAEASQGYLEGNFRYSAALIVEFRIPAGVAGGIPFPN